MAKTMAVMWKSKIMKRKGPPYKVVRGQPGETPPPYVESILEGYFTLAGDSKQIHEKLKLVGLVSSLQKDSFSRPSLRFHFNSKPDAENTEIQKLFIALNLVGFKFAYDYKSATAPSGIMMDLQEMGVLGVPFDEISWLNPREWQLTTYETKST